MQYGLIYFLFASLCPLSLLFFLSQMLIIQMSACSSFSPVGMMIYGDESYFMDQYGFVLSFMTWILTFGCVLTIMLSNSEDYTLSMILIFMASCSLVVYLSQSFLDFYMNFEMTLFPILMMIMGWGNQPERLSAGMALMMYTITGSLPLLAYVLVMKSSSVDYFFQINYLGGHFSELVFYLVSLAFLVKLPMFLVHMWLPKAHVEAPVYGSMFLAGTLLKLGGIGLIRFSGALNSPASDKIIMISVFSLISVGLICSFMTDMKVIIAYSSVAHMALALVVIMSMSDLNLWAGLMIFITHGFSSSLMFYMAYITYTRSSSRSVLLNASSLSWSGVFSLFWFISCVGLMGGPPAATLLGEFMGIMMISIWWNPMILFLSVGAFLGGAYSMVLFYRVYHNYYHMINKILSPMSFLESLVAVFHIYWLLAYFWVFSWIMTVKY